MARLPQLWQNVAPVSRGTCRGVVGDALPPFLLTSPPTQEGAVATAHAARGCPTASIKDSLCILAPHWWQKTPLSVTWVPHCEQYILSSFRLCILSHCGCSALGGRPSPHHSQLPLPISYTPEPRNSYKVDGPFPCASDAPCPGSPRLGHRRSPREGSSLGEPLGANWRAFDPTRSQVSWVWEDVPPGRGLHHSTVSRWAWASPEDAGSRHLTSCRIEGKSKETVRLTKNPPTSPFRPSGMKACRRTPPLSPPKPAHAGGPSTTWHRPVSLFWDCCRKGSWS